jgi:exosome complex component RRP41
MPKMEMVTLLQMDGILSTKETEDCVKLAIEGCQQVYEVQKEALKKKYGIDSGEETEEESEEVEESAEADEEEKADE